MPADQSLPLYIKTRGELAALLNELASDGRIKGWWWPNESTTLARAGFCTRDEANLAGVYWFMIGP